VRCAGNSTLRKRSWSRRSTGSTSAR